MAYRKRIEMDKRLKKIRHLISKNILFLVAFAIIMVVRFYVYFPTFTFLGIPAYAIPGGLVVCLLIYYSRIRKQYLRNIETDKNDLDQMD